jgi:hypothetical protein
MFSGFSRIALLLGALGVLLGLTFTNASAQQAVTGLNVPCANGVQAGMTTWHGGGSLARRAYDFICFINNAPDPNRRVYAPVSGRVAFVSQSWLNSNNNQYEGRVSIKMSNGMCVDLIHFAPNTIRVQLNQEITNGTLLGRWSTFAGHIHLGVRPGNSRCTGIITTNEQPVIFNEVGYVPSQRICIRMSNPRCTHPRQFFTSTNVPGNGGGGGGGGGSTLQKFSRDAVSTATKTTAEYILQVCADNIIGKTVNATLYRDAYGAYAAKIWRYSQVATSRCVTFTDMEGPGNVFPVTYYSVASLEPISDADARSKRTACAVASDYLQMCDSR